MNNVILTGRLTKDVDMYAGEKESCGFTLAVQKTKEKADFFRCSAWEHTAKFMQEYTKKGDLIAVRGKLTTYQAKDETWHVGIVVDNVEILSRPKKEA